MELDKAKQVLCNAKLTVEEQEARDTLFKEFENLVRIAIETAFDKSNKDTELLCRRLLAIKKIELKDGLYTRSPFDFEQHFRIDGVEYDREKMFFINDDKLDEYRKEYNQMLIDKKVEKYECSIKELGDEIENLKNKHIPDEI